MKEIKIKVWGLLSLNKRQILIFELFFLTLFIGLTIFLFTYDFKPHLNELGYSFHAKYAKYFSLVCTFLIIIETQFLWSQFTKAQLKIIHQQKTELKSKNIKIKESIKYASQIQKILLPSENKLQRLLKEYFVFYKPRDIVSGDFYWIEEFNDKLILSVADCTGHGVPGAFVSAVNISLLNEVFLSSKEAGEKLSPAKILETLQERLLNIVETAEREESIFDGMDIAICIIDKKNKQYLYAGALLSIVHVTQLNDQDIPSIKQIKPDMHPIGMGGLFKHNYTYQDNVISYKDGDILYLYTDGYKDQFGGKYNKKFLNKNFLTLISEIAKKPLAIQAEDVKNKLISWQGDNAQVDDITVLGVKL